MSELGLDVQLGCDRPLGVEVVNLLVQTVIGPPSVGIIVKSTGTQGEPIIERACDGLASIGVVVATEPCRIKPGRVLFEERCELVETRGRRWRCSGWSRRCSAGLE